MFRRLNLRSAEERKKEELLYEMAFEELSVGNIRPGLWAKAMVKAEGDEAKVKSIYLKYRVQSMLDELRIAYESQACVTEKKPGPAPAPKKKGVKKEKTKLEKPVEPEFYVLDRQGNKRELVPQEGGGYLAKTMVGEKFFHTEDDAEKYFN